MRLILGYSDSQTNDSNDFFLVNQTGAPHLAFNKNPPIHYLNKLEYGDIIIS